jgi:glutamyl-tRNA synthetase
VRACVPLVRERATTFLEAADRLDFVFRDPPAFDEAAVKKLLVPASAAHLVAMAEIVERVEPWGAPALEQAIEPWVSGAGLAMKDVAQPARVALTGRAASPGLFDVIAILGRDRAVERLRAGGKLAAAS